MAPKPKRGRGRTRGRPATPPRRLDEDLRRHQLAREVIPQLVRDVEEFLDYFPRIAQRRLPDRVAGLSSLASDVLAWAALGASRADRQLPLRCFASSCLLAPDPHRLAVRLLAVCGMGAEVRVHLREIASRVDDLPTEGLDGEMSEAPGSLVDEVRAFLERLQAREATSADGRELGRLLLVSAIALNPFDTRDDETGDLTVAGALGLLEEALPADGSHIRYGVGTRLRLLAAELPGMVEHAEADLESELEHDDEDEAEESDEELDGKEEEEFILDEILAGLDERLSVTDDAADAADVAFQGALALLGSGLTAIGMHPRTFGHQARAMAAADALMWTSGVDGPFMSEAGEDAGLIRAAYARAEALLKADVPEQLPPPGSVEVLLPELDHLVYAMRNLADSELVDELAGGLALISGAAQILWLGLRLGHKDADTRRQMAAALGTLDPLALAGLPEPRAAAAEVIRALVRSAHTSSGPAAR